MNASTAEKNYLHKLIVETDDEKDAINLGLRQLENGEGIPHEEVWKKADNILVPAGQADHLNSMDATFILSVGFISEKFKRIPVINPVKPGCSPGSMR